jgi:HK97 gp10 family phage protein
MIKFDIQSDPQNSQSFIVMKNIDANMARAIRQGFYFAGKDMVRYCREKIVEKNKTGRLYMLSKERTNKGIKKIARVKHRASAAGEFPANFTGNLQRSIDFGVQGWDQMDFGARNEDNKHGINYAKYLEKGTPKMAARPFLKPTIEARQKNCQGFITHEVNKAIGIK